MDRGIRMKMLSKVGKMIKKNLGTVVILLLGWGMFVLALMGAARLWRIAGG